MPLIHGVNMIHCWNCDCYTKTIEPIIINRYGLEKIKVIGCCDRCKKGKARNYSYNLPSDWYKIPIKQIFGNIVIYKNGDSIKILDLVDNYINQ